MGVREESIGVGVLKTWVVRIIQAWTYFLGGRPRVGLVPIPVLADRGQARRVVARR